MMDLSFWQAGINDDEPKIRLFQSLLWWICHFDTRYLLTLSLLFCFNPCYDGFVILTNFWLAACASSRGFNPCYDGFVILTILRFPFGVSLKGFNPCYDGFVILTSSVDLSVSVLESVSILVMMDLSFWHDYFTQMAKQITCFNPCYDGFVILTWNDVRCDLD